MNAVTLIGNLGADPDVRITPHGKKVATIRLATEERYRTDAGDWKSSTDWHTVVGWERVADVLESLAKGDRVVVLGKLKPRSYEDRTGAKRSVVEVLAATVARDALRGERHEPQSSRRDERPATPAQLSSAAAEPDYFDDDVPF